MVCTCWVYWVADGIFQFMSFIIISHLQLQMFARQRDKTFWMHQAHESQQHTQNCRGVLCFLEHLISRSLLGLYIASVGAKAWQIHTCESHTDHSPNSPPLDFCHLFLYYLCILWLVLLIMSIFFAPNFLVREPNSYKWFWN